MTLTNEHDTDAKKRPLLIYDGDCGFCKYWVNYWRQLTGTKVDYQPYQAVGADFPSLTQEDFQSAVQYVAPGGTISSAAKASFLTLSNAPGGGLWLWLYFWLPGFAFFSEKIYAWIAAHREFSYHISLFLWGRDFHPPKYKIISWLFLRLLALIFFSAFVSFGVQAIGLIGHQGIVPVSELVTAANEQLGMVRYWLIPMVFWLNTSDIFIQAVCWGGALTSVLLFFNVIPRLSLILLYILYLSLIYAGQVFMTFQWDMFLVEAGILALFLVRPSMLGIWLMRWLLFRFIIGAGLVKIMSGDPVWWDMTALSYYFETEPLPTPLAWYAHHLPSFLLKFGTISALAVELIIPFFIFLPRRLRFFGAFCILLMQTLIILTGNYNFFNLQTIVLCLVLFDDAAIKTILPSRITSLAEKKSRTDKKRLAFTITGVTFAVITVWISLIQFKGKFFGNISAPVATIYEVIAPLQLVNAYGPFAVITKERMEIIIEGSNDGVDWKEYSFRYKPGALDRRPPVNIPHQPRLDWQMWFAALGSPANNQWFLRFMQRLLENSPSVVALLENNPFPDAPPTYVRALFYQYHFSTPEEKKTTHAWWTRELQRFYLPAVNISAPAS